MSDRNKLDLDTLKIFALGGRATLTVENTATGHHRTYQLRRKKGADDKAPIFVSVLTGTDNDNWRHYTYLGNLWLFNRNGTACEPRYGHGRKSRIQPDHATAQGAKWLVDVLAGRTKPSPSTVFWHEGRCCFCGRKLTVPGSCEVGYGPDCAEQRNLPYPGRKRQERARTCVDCGTELPECTPFNVNGEPSCVPCARKLEERDPRLPPVKPDPGEFDYDAEIQRRERQDMIQAAEAKQAQEEALQNGLIQGSSGTLYEFA